MCIIKFFILKLLIYYSSKLIIKFIIHKNFIILILTNRLFKYFSQSPQFRSVFVFFFSLIIIFFKKIRSQKFIKYIKVSQKIQPISQPFSNDAWLLFIMPLIRSFFIQDNFHQIFPQLLTLQCHSPLIMFPNQLILCPSKQTGSLSTDIGRGYQKWTGWRFTMSQIVHISHNIGTVINS